MLVLNDIEKVGKSSLSALTEVFVDIRMLIKEDSVDFKFDLLSLVAILVDLHLNGELVVVMCKIERR